MSRTAARASARPAFALAVLVLAVLFAGCLGGNGKPGNGGDDVGSSDGGPRTGGDPSVSETAGAIEAVVTDESFNPIVAALVTILEPKLEDGSSLAAETGADGIAAFSELAPGTYKLVAEKLPFDSLGKSVQVTANEVTKVAFHLPMLEVEDAARVETYEFRGFIGCGAAALWSTPAGFAFTACGGEGSNVETSFALNLTEGIQDVVIAAKWTPTGGVIGRHLLVELIAVDEDCDTSTGFDCPVYGQEGGPSPLLLRINETKIRSEYAVNENRTSVNALIRVFPYAEDASVYYQQPFTLYVNLFYNQRAPDDFTGIPDA